MTIVIALTGILSVFTPQHVHPQPAAGDAVATSALTAEAVRQLLDGEGMGLALPAELHQYPGPKHLLDLAKELQLTADQQKQIAAIRQEVLEKARPLGHRIVEAERALDAAFKAGTLTEAELEKQLDMIAAMQGDLRLVHLRAHLVTKPLLSAEQVRRYYELRR